MRAPTIALLLTVAAATSFAAPYDNRGFVDGANHHVGDAGFRAREGREPTAADEKLRMHDHLVYMREVLGSRPATRPDLASARARLLGYLDDYIAAGTTPHNEALPWRTPVFIDDDGRICAVGYLIERSVGRDLAERIATAHRYEYLEDIAAAMPEVDSWIAASGLTLDELASIQPGYMQPAVEDWVRWNVDKLPPAEGPYSDPITTGAWREHKMEGAWTRTIAGHVVGKGTLHRGRGAWTSFYPDGTKLAEGEIVDNDPQGTWKMYHPSGRIAAEGEMSRGVRVGAWHFYYDTAGEIPITTGVFAANGMIEGDWKHYDGHGRLVAISSSAPPVHDYGFGGYLLSIIPGKDGVQHDIHIIGGPDRNRLELLIGDG
ncbi:MAG TPA: hypothetical protein VGO00_03835, partial [Kofleriaceae bacterium]|nr:hypothetical protein [Kofleriaceae bacterium]